MDNSTREESTEPMSLYEDPETYTEEMYDCFSLECYGEGCETVILYFLSPDYNLRVGKQDGIYPEITFSPFPGEIVEEHVVPWSRHAYATDKVWQVQCPDCGRVNQYVLTVTSSVLECPLGKTHKARIPRNRVPYVTTPKEGWDT